MQTEPHHGDAILSSRGDDFLRWLLIGMVATATIALGTASVLTGRIQWGPIAVFVVSLGLVLMLSPVRCKVRIKKNQLYVSGWFKTVVIPLIEIAKVEETRTIRDRFVTIHFARETLFGRSIRFTPRCSSDLDLHPVVRELEARINFLAEQAPVTEWRGAGKGQS